MKTLALATLLGFSCLGLAACAPDYSERLDTIERQNTEIQRDIDDVSERLAEIESLSESTLESTEQAGATALENADALSELSKAIEELSVARADTSREDEGVPLLRHEASEEEQAIVRQAAACTAALLGDNVISVVVDEIEREIWNELALGEWASFAEFELAMWIICNE